MAKAFEYKTCLSAANCATWHNPSAMTRLTTVRDDSRLDITNQTVRSGRTP